MIVSRRWPKTCRARTTESSVRNPASSRVMASAGTPRVEERGAHVRWFVVAPGAVVAAEQEMFHPARAEEFGGGGHAVVEVRVAVSMWPAKF